jgi:hypothetical protein
MTVGRGVRLTSGGGMNAGKRATRGGIADGKNVITAPKA